MGLDLKFWKLRMRPGAPVGFGLLPEARPWIGLPGNPVSTMVTFELFVRPAIRKMMGHALPFRRATRGDRRGSRSSSARSCSIFSGRSSADPEADETARPPVRPSARLTGPQGSGILTSMVQANALLIIPEGQHETPAGAEAMAIVLNDPAHLPEPPF